VSIAASLFVPKEAEATPETSSTCSPSMLRTTEVRLTEIWESDELLKAHLATPDPEFSAMLATAKIEHAKVVAYDGTNERVLMSR
jgi:quinol monooxygenase YgiN